MTPKLPQSFRIFKKMD